jgi:hypothetical protein
MEIINRERMNSVLIESSGLEDEYLKKQREASKVDEEFSLKTIPNKCLRRVVPNDIISEFFPYSLLLISKTDYFNGKIIGVF